MPRFICATCGTQYAEAAEPPVNCNICKDDRQYVLRAGQRWKTHEDLLQNHAITMGEDDGIFALSVTPFFCDQPAGGFSEFHRGECAMGVAKHRNG